METPDFRALCAELEREFSSLYAAMSARFDFNDDYMERMDDLRDRARAALAAEPQGPTDEELDALWWKYIEAPDVVFALGKRGFREAARTLLAHCTPPRPIPVTERLPRAEDCDDEGRCWWFNPGCPALSNPHLATSSWRLTCMIASKPMGTHWLPADALPLPGVEGC